MSINIELLNKNETNKWDEYVLEHPQATPYHLSGWPGAIAGAYKHRTFYLTARKSYQESEGAIRSQVAGVLPLIQVKSVLFGNTLVSIPYADYAGVLADDEKIEIELIKHALRLANRLKCSKVDIRHVCPREYLSSESGAFLNDGMVDIKIRNNKFRMLRKLPASSNELMKSFKSKLRNQIKRPIKEGFYAKKGNVELFDDFYHVFARNMRDLGSPVHSRQFIRSICEAYGESSTLVIVYSKKIPVACGLMIEFKDKVVNPWSSSLQKYKRMSPNMLLYWTMLEYACDQGYEYFDFGRSSYGEGTYKFKEQWGAAPHELNWASITLNGSYCVNKEESAVLQKAVHLWKMLPVPLTKIIGPSIRRSISL